ncbi:Hypothetical predicted protein [Paramuricea clavata]|uniref:Uncharacterized protein n=1 Tax=Paramuricea clavata TaxID=317549 RepID=A0A6S7H9F9_PARCT|nr:Hypothetical predicted protein [Paramuricea clavata]
MATQFYLTLPSNSSMAYFQNNTVANFRVKLAETIVLPGQWEVALTELHYPHTWSTLKRGVQQTFLYKIGSIPYQTVVLKETQYSSIEQLTKALNAGMSKEIQSKVKFSYNRSSRKVSVDVKHDTTLWFTGELATVLGFDQDTLIEKKTSSPYAADINGGFSSMYVYTDIVDAQFVGDVKVPLLRIVNIEGEYGNTVHASFRNLQYVLVKVNSFETIEVNIKNDQNENVSFEFGKSIATLHFRQKRSQYFI